MFCTKANAEIKAALNKFDAYVDAHVDTALKITSTMKSLLASPIGDVLTALIPGTADDVLRAKLVSGLSKVVDALSIVDACKQYTDLNDKLKCFMQQLAAKDPALQDALLFKIASLLVGALDGNQLQQSLYDLYTQAKYYTTVAAKA